MVHLVLADGRGTLPREVVRLMASARQSLDIIAPVLLEEPRLRAERSTVRLRVISSLDEGSLDPLALRRLARRFLEAQYRFAEDLDGCLVIADRERVYVGGAPFGGKMAAGALVSGKGKIARHFFEGVWKHARGGGSRLLELAASRTEATDGPVQGRIKGRAGTYLDGDEGVLNVDPKGWPSLLKAASRAPIATLAAAVRDGSVRLDASSRFRITDHLKKDAEVNAQRGATTYTLACGVTAVHGERHGMKRGTLVTVEGTPGRGCSLKAGTAYKAWAIPKARFPIEADVADDDKKLAVITLCNGTRDMVEVESEVKAALGEAAVDLVLQKLITVGAVSYER